MKRRKVSSAYLKLDSEDVILAKDQGTWRATGHCQEKDVLTTRNSGQMATVDRGIEDGLGEVPVHSSHQPLALTTRFSDKGPSQLVDVTHQASVVELCHTGTEHAMPGSPQHVSRPMLDDESMIGPEQAHIQRNIHNTLLATDIEPDETAGIHTNGGNPLASRTHGSQQHNDSLDIRPTHVRGELSNPRISKGKQRSTLSSRSKYSTQRSHALGLQTEVDWSEGLRPTTSDESFEADSDCQGTSVSTPSPGIKSALHKKSKQKCEMPKSRSNSEKRRKPGKGKDISANEKDQESPQLLLTANPEAPLSEDQVISCQAADHKHHDGPSQSLRETIMPGKSYTPTADTPSGHGPGKFTTQQHAVIEISSGASSIPGSGSSRSVPENPGSGAPKKGRMSPNGRGKAVGQKLFDALRAIELDSQVIPDPASLTQQRELEFETTQLKDVKHLQLQETFKNQQATRNDTNPPPNDLTVMDNNQEPAYIPEPSVLEPASSLDEHKLEFQTELEGSESQHNVSSPSSTGIRAIPLTEWLARGRRPEQTPESQRPLLNDPTPVSYSDSCLKVVKTIPKHSIVDQNGSPRAVLQDKSGFTGSSTSDDDRDSGGSSISSSSDDRRTWTKFQRDMFLEYGITAQEMAHARNRPRTFRDPAQARAIKTETVLMRNEQQHVQAGATTMVPARANGMCTIEKSSCSLKQEITMEQDRGISPDRPCRDILFTENPGARQSIHESSRRDSDLMEWTSALQAAQESARHLLLDTNQNLASQLAAEQATIQQVLQIYRQGYNRILDDLFQAQERRMELYRQQMASVKTQHTQICQEMIRGLQELDRRVQQG